MSIILVSHSMEDILRTATRLVILAAGRLVGEGVPYELFRDTALIERASLDIPHILRLERQLEAAGYPVKECTTVEDLANRILASR